MTFKEMTGCSVPLYLCKFCFCVCVRARKIWWNKLLYSQLPIPSCFCMIVYLDLITHVSIFSKSNFFWAPPLSLAHFKLLFLSSYHVQDKTKWTPKVINPGLLFQGTVWIYMYVHKHFLCKKWVERGVAYIKCYGGVNNAEL